MMGSALKVSLVTWLYCLVIVHDYHSRLAPLSVPQLGTTVMGIVIRKILGEEELKSERLSLEKGYLD